MVRSQPELFERDMEIVPARRLAARVASVLRSGADGFVTAPVETLEFDLEGIPGDLHRGFVRAAGGREPWYARGTPMRSGRQVSIVSVEELERIALAMDLPRMQAEWLGANMVLEGLPRLSFLPAGTRIAGPDGAVLVVEAMNAPCRRAGGAVATANPGRDGLDLLFAKAARRLRGVVASVERAGTIDADNDVAVSLPEQWIYG